MVRPADRFDEGLRALRLGSRYSGSTSGSIEWIFALVEPLAREIRDQAVSEAGTRRRVPEILAGVNNDSTFNAIAAPSPNGGYIIAVNHGTLILVHDIRAYTLLATQDPAGAHAPGGTVFVRPRFVWLVEIQIGFCTTDVDSTASRFSRAPASV